MFSAEQFCLFLACSIWGIQHPFFHFILSPSLSVQTGLSFSETFCPSPAHLGDSCHCPSLVLGLGSGGGGTVGQAEDSREHRLLSLAAPVVFSNRLPSPWISSWQRLLQAGWAENFPHHQVLVLFA